MNESEMTIPYLCNLAIEVLKITNPGNQADAELRADAVKVIRQCLRGFLNDKGEKAK